MRKFDEFINENKIFNIYQLRNTNTIFKKLMEEGRIPCVFKDGELIKLDKKIRNQKSFPTQRSENLDKEEWVYFLTEQEFNTFSTIKSQINDFKNTVDETFKSILVTFLKGDKSQLLQLMDILSNIIKLKDSDTPEPPSWLKD